MGNPQFSKLIEPNLAVADLLEALLDRFTPPVDGPGEIEKLYRYQDGPVWLVRHHISMPDRDLYSGVQIAFFRTDIGQEIDVMPVVWLDLREQGLLVQPSIPKEAIHRVSMNLVRLPGVHENPSRPWEETLLEALNDTWKWAMEQAKYPERYATEHVQSGAR